MSFETEVRAVEGRLRGLRLNILVWGPGDIAGEHHGKRRQVQQELRDFFVEADVRFSEELEHVPAWGVALEHHERELWHLAACHVCVVLDASKGSGEEIAHVIGTAHASKLLILTHEKYESVNSFPAALRKHQNQVFYD